MKVDVFLHLHHDDPKLDQILTELRKLVQQGEVMSQAMDDLEAQVAANADVVSSAVTLIQGIAAQLAAAGTDPAKLKALQDSLKSSDDALAAAVAANTPAEPPTP